MPGRFKTAQGKKILIKALGDRLPSSILQRKKMGFGVPIAIWFRGPLRELLWDCLTGSQFLNRGIVARPFLEALLREHQSGRRDNSHWLWILLMLEMWFSEFENPVAPVGSPIHLTPCPQ